MIELAPTIPTKLELMLGKNYKWWYALITAYKSSTAYWTSTIFYIVGRFLVLGLTILVWYLNIGAGSDLFSFQTIFTYYVIGNFLFWQSGMHWNIAQSIFTGQLSSSLLIPQNYFLIAFFRDVGWWLFSNILETFIVGILIIAGWNSLQHASFDLVLVFVLIRFVGFGIAILLQILYGMFAFWFREVSGILTTVNDLQFYLSGRAIPFNASVFLLPLQFTPYALMYYLPIQIYLGVYDSRTIAGVFGLGGLWIVLLLALTNYVFKKGIVRYEGVGL